MFAADGLVYLELQKTGGSHIRRLLEKYVQGRFTGKHNRVTLDTASSYVIGSIRNPWDWYVSLWAYGVGGQGAVRSRTLTGIDLDYYYRMLPKAMGKNWLTPREFIISLVNDAVKPAHQWSQTYKDTSDPALYRTWLKMLLDRKRRFDIGEGYGFSPLSKSAGLMTYRYFRLYTSGNGVYRDQRLKHIERMADFDLEFNITRDMIRTESLEEDFIRILAEAGQSLSEEQISTIRGSAAEKTNVSVRRSAEFYYDNETIDLVAYREKYLIDKYGYQPPA
jgi:hypothetical protein